MIRLLYSLGSPFARRVRILLHEQGLDYDSDVKEGLRPVDDFVGHNPILQVPVLYDGSRRLFDSALIMDYLLDAYGAPEKPPDGFPPLAPSMTSPERRWEDMQVIAAIDGLTQSLLLPLLLKPNNDLPYLARLKARSTACIDWLEARIGPEGFWPGYFSAMDICLVSCLLYGERRGVLDWRSSCGPQIRRFVERVSHRPSILATPVDGRSV